MQIISAQRKTGAEPVILLRLFFGIASKAGRFSIDRRIRQRRLRLHAQKRRLRAAIFVEILPVGQKKTLARGILPAIQNIVNDMKA